MSGFNYGSLFPTIAQLRNQVEFMDQFLSLIYPEYSQVKNLVLETQRQRAANNSTNSAGVFQFPGDGVGLQQENGGLLQQSVHSPLSDGYANYSFHHSPAAAGHNLGHSSFNLYSDNTCCNNGSGGALGAMASSSTTTPKPSSGPGVKERRKKQTPGMAGATASVTSTSPKRRGRKRKYPLPLKTSCAVSSVPTTPTPPSISSAVSEDCKTPKSEPVTWPSPTASLGSVIIEETPVPVPIPFTIASTESEPSAPEPADNQIYYTSVVQMPCQDRTELSELYNHAQSSNLNCLNLLATVSSALRPNEEEEEKVAEAIPTDTEAYSTTQSNYCTAETETG